MNSVVRPVDHPSLRDRAVSARYQVQGAARVGWMALRQGPRRMVRTVRRYPWLRNLIEASTLQDTMTRGRRGLYREACAFVMSAVNRATLDTLDGILNAPERTILHEIVRLVGLLEDSDRATTRQRRFHLFVCESRDHQNPHAGPDVAEPAKHLQAGHVG